MTTQAVAAAQIVPETWKEAVYLFCGKTWRDEVNKAGQRTITINMAFIEHVYGENLGSKSSSHFESLVELYKLYKPQVDELSALQTKIDRLRDYYSITWTHWSQLFNPKFLLNLLAYVVNAFFRMLWNLSGRIDEKRALISRITQELQRLLIPQSQSMGKVKIDGRGYLLEFKFLTDAKGARNPSSKHTIEISIFWDFQRIPFLWVDRAWEPHKGVKLYPESELDPQKEYKCPVLLVELPAGSKACWKQSQIKMAWALMTNEHLLAVGVQARTDQLQAGDFSQFNGFEDNTWSWAEPNCKRWWCLRESSSNNVTKAVDEVLQELNELRKPFFPKEPLTKHFIRDMLK